MRKRKHKAPTTENIIGNFAGKPVRVIIIVVALILIIFPLYWLITSDNKRELDSIMPGASGRAASFFFYHGKNGFCGKDGRRRGNSCQYKRRYY